MALTADSRSATFSTSNPLQKNLDLTNINTVVYTVPEGRYFKGYANGSQTTSSFIKINGVDMYNYAGGSGTSIASFGSQYELTLVAGTVITTGSTSEGILIGVEYDA